MWNSNLVREDLKVAMDTNFCNYIFEKAYTATINLSSYQFESRAWDINLHLLKTRIINHMGRHCFKSVSFLRWNNFCFMKTLDYLGN